MWVTRLWMCRWRKVSNEIVTAPFKVNSEVDCSELWGSQLHQSQQCTSHSTHKPPSFTLKMEAVHTYQTLVHTSTTQHTNPKEQDQLFSCFHISPTVQAQCVHNIAAATPSLQRTTATNTPTFKIRSPTPHYLTPGHITKSLKHISHSLYPRVLHLFTLFFICTAAC